MQTCRLSSSVRIALIGTAIAGAASLAGQDNAPGPARVVVAVRVVDRSGAPVPGLQPGDFQLTVDGRPAPVGAVEVAAPVPATPGAPAAPGPASGALAIRRIVLAVNRQSIAAGGGRVQLELAAAFLDRLPPSTMAAVWVLPAEHRQLVFTSDRAVTRAALGAVTGAKSQPAGRTTLSPSEAVRIARGDNIALETVSDRECPQAGGARDEVARCREELRREAVTQVDQVLLAAQQTTRELRPLVRALERTRGFKHLVILTGGVVGTQELDQEVRAAVAEAAAGRVTVHAVQVPQLAGASGGRASASDPSPELTLARETGGLVMVGNDVRDAFVRLERELAAEYALAITPGTEQRDGRLHEMAVRVTRAGATVRAARLVRLDPGVASPATGGAPALGAAPAAPAPATAPASAAAPTARTEAGAATPPAGQPREPPTLAPPSEGAAAPPPGQPPEAPTLTPPATDSPAPGAAPSGELATTSLETLLARAGEYVSRFERAVGATVLEERYVQIIKIWTLPPKEPDAKRLAWRDDESAPTRDLQMSERRQTRADVLLVQLPNKQWTAFRDTLEVNGRVLPGHEDRLRKLFLEGTEDAWHQLREIREASADWNLGGLYRDINVPIYGLMAVHPTYQKRFAFRTVRVTGQCRVISFTETVKPTLTRSKRGDNIPLVGNVCLDKTGAVWSTRIDFDGRYSARGSVRVTYRPEARVEQVLVPDTMWEWFLLPAENAQGLPLFVEAMATYSNLRQFTVTTSEVVP